MSELLSMAQTTMAQMREMHKAIQKAGKAMQEAQTVAEEAMQKAAEKVQHLKERKKRNKAKRSSQTIRREMEARELRKQKSKREAAVAKAPAVAATITPNFDIVSINQICFEFVLSNLQMVLN